MLSGVVREETEASSDLVFSCSVFKGEVKRRFVLFQRVFPDPAESSELVPGHNRSLSAASWDQS